jgi:hypothetical protein
MGIRNESHATPPGVAPNVCPCASSNVRATSLDGWETRRHSGYAPHAHDTRPAHELEEFHPKRFVALACFFQQNCEGRILTKIIQHGIGR